MSDVFQVPVIKAKGKTVEVDSAALPDASYKGVFAAGLKACVNTGTTGDKYKKEAYTDKNGNYDEEAHHAACIARAQEKVNELIAGTFKFGRAAAGPKTDYKLTIEARRLARDMVKTLIKNAGKRVTEYKSSAITAAANELLASEEGGPIWERAKANLEGIKPPSKFKLSIAEDPELVAKNAEKAKKEKIDVGQLSAAKAGKVRTRAMGSAAHLN